MHQREYRNITAASVEHTEAQQQRLASYNRRVGRYLLYILPLLLVALTTLSVTKTVDAIVLLDWFVLALAVFGLNTLFLGLLVSTTRSAFTKRLNLERQNGRPLDSLQGFTTIRDNVDRTLFTIRIVFLLSLIVLVLYIIYIHLALSQSDLSTSVAVLGLGLSLVCFGASLLVKTVSVDVASVTGMSDFYRPSSHELLLDNFFSDVFRCHLDPVARLKWDEFVENIRVSMRKEFIDSILSKEPDESPVSFAIEKLLYLHYMEFSGVLSHERVIRELDEVLILDRERYHPDTGVKMGTRQYFHTADIFKVFRLIERMTPAFFDIIDRLQLELIDNIAVMAGDPIYVDASVQEVCKKDDECHLMILLFNNTESPRDYIIRVTAAGLEPTELRMSVSAEGRGGNSIPTRPIPLVSDGDLDVAHTLATLLKNSVAVWLTLEPSEIGTKTIQVFVEDERGNVVEGKTMPVAVIRNIEYLFKRMTSGITILAGAVTPAFNALRGIP